MISKNTVLVGCEVLCITPESELIACPLSVEEQKGCKQRLQYQAGIREVVEWLIEHSDVLNKSWHSLLWDKRAVIEQVWQAKLKEWVIEDV